MAPAVYCWTLSYLGHLSVQDSQGLVKLTLLLLLRSIHDVEYTGNGEPSSPIPRPRHSPTFLLS
jgi:hypothetical protein